jgi:hypothetical protein
MTKNTASSQTDRLKKVVELRLKLLSQNLLSQTTNASWMTSHISLSQVTEWQQKSYCDSTAPESVKVIKKSKFPGKILVWLAISEKGISDPVVYQ